VIRTQRFLARLLLLAAAAAPLAAGAAPVTVKMATLVPDGTSWSRILQELRERWAKDSNGEVKLIIYPGGTQGDDRDVVRKMRLGSLSAGLLTSVGVADIDPTVFALQVPMLYRSQEEVDYVLQKMLPRIEQSLAAKGFVLLSFVDGGWIHFFTKSPVRVPDDLKPLKLFAWAGDNEAVEIWKKAGFNPVPLPSTEISTALQTGLVSAVPAPTTGAVLLQWYNHAKNMTDVNWSLLLGAIIVKKDIWEKVAPELRPKLLEGAREAGRKFREDMRRSSTSDVEAMKKRGLNVVSVDAQAEGLWRQAAESAYSRIRGGVVPADAFDEAQKHLQEYRKAHPK